MLLVAIIQFSLQALVAARASSRTPCTTLRCAHDYRTLDRLCGSQVEPQPNAYTYGYYRAEDLGGYLHCPGNHRQRGRGRGRIHSKINQWLRANTDLFEHGCRAGRCRR